MLYESYNSTDKQYYYHLNGLKGLACLFILIGHYLGLYKYAESFVPSIYILDKLNSSIFSFLINESYWLYLFFVVSGYLVAKSKFENVKELFLKSINRFLRLALPIFFSYLVIYVIYLVFGFHTADTLSLFQCQWFQNFYTSNYSIKNVIFAPFEVLLFGKCYLNCPYWVLRKMLISSLLIYLLKYWWVKFEKPKYEPYVFFALILITVLSYMVSPIITACLMGMLVSFYSDKDITYKSYYAFWFIVIMMALYIMPETLKAALFFASLIIYIPRIKWMNKIFSSRLFQFMGNISWGIYSFHWPLIGSIGALLLMKLSESLGLVIAYFFSFFVILTFAFVLSTVFYYSFEKFSLFLSKELIRFLSYIFDIRFRVKSNKI